jgi:hypothetical protein
MALYATCGFNIPSKVDVQATLVSNFGSPFVTADGPYVGTGSVQFTNTGFGEQSLKFPISTYSSHYWGFHYRQTLSVADGSWAGSVEILRANNNSGSRLLTLRTTGDGKLQLLTTASYINQGYTARLNFGRWYFIEVVYNVNGSVQLWIDDGLVIDGSVADPQNPDWLYFRWANLGQSYPNFANMYFADGSGSLVNSRLGPINIESWYPAADDQNTLTGFGAGGVNAINERFPSTSPDYDSTFLHGSSGLLLFDVQKLDKCTGRILALTINSVAKALDGGGGTFEVVANLDPTQSNLSVIAGGTLTTAWKFFQSIRYADPNGLVWTDGKVEAALWGVRPVTGNLAITSLWLDKIKSLRPSMPYDCGQLGSYVYTKS